MSLHQFVADLAAVLKERDALLNQNGSLVSDNTALRIQVNSLTQENVALKAEIATLKGEPKPVDPAPEPDPVEPGPVDPGPVVPDPAPVDPGPVDPSPVEPELPLPEPQPSLIWTPEKLHLYRERPPLVNFNAATTKRFHITSATQTIYYSAPVGQDVVITFAPGLVHTGAITVIGSPRHVQVWGGIQREKRIAAYGFTGVFSVLGTDIDIRKQKGDGIVWIGGGPNACVLIDNVIVVGIAGTMSGHHGDCFQQHADSQVKRYTINRAFCRTGYQVGMLSCMTLEQFQAQKGKGVITNHYTGEAFISNLRAEFSPEDTTNTYAFLFRDVDGRGPRKHTYPLTLHNVTLRPRPGMEPSRYALIPMPGEKINGVDVGGYRDGDTVRWREAGNIRGGVKIVSASSLKLTGIGADFRMPGDADFATDPNYSLAA